VKTLKLEEVKGIIFLITLCTGKNYLFSCGRIKIDSIIKVISAMKAIKNDVKIYIKTAPTCFGTVTPSSRSSLSMLGKVSMDNKETYWQIILK
jgi:hypothetical protein